MLQAVNVTKNYASGDKTAQALRGVSLRIEPGEFVSIVGPSGSGKTTLLNVLSSLLSPDSGQILYNGADVAGLDDAGLDSLRSRDFSMIFQFHHLLPYLTALENVLLPFMGSLRRVDRDVVEHGRDCLARVGLSGKEDRLPGGLSGGEQQRVAIARALVKNSRILFADEPTGSLDSATGRGVMDLLRELNREGLSVAMVTHNLEFADYADRMVNMQDGLLAA